MTGYEGICAICSEPIGKGQGIQVKENDRHYHMSCTIKQPNSYYYKLDQFKERFNNGENIAKLMTEMERFYNILLVTGGKI